jgi:hypothetical protein
MYMKNRKPWDEPTPPHPDITYKPCKFCGSMDYDFAEADVTDDGIYEPEFCDVCGFGLKLTTHSLTIQ